MVLPVHVENLEVSRRKIATTLVKVATVTHTREHLIEEELAHEHVEIERVPIGRYVETVPPIQQNGDLTIMPVVEEVIVVERKSAWCTDRIVG